MDILNRFLIDDEITVFACDTTFTCREAQELHDTYPTSTAALSRTLTAAVLMGAQLKNSGSLVTININGGGPAGTLIATADHKCRVKGCIGNPKVLLPAKNNGQLDVGGAVGTDGLFTVIRDEGMKEPYIGKTPLVTGEIAEDMAHYYLMSQQQPSAVYLCSWVDVDTKILVAGGYIISLLPGACEKSIETAEKGASGLLNYALMLMNMTPEQAIKKAFEGHDVKMLASQTPKYHCDCSTERFAEGIAALGKEEIEAIIEEQGGAEVVCHFCNKRYNFSADALRAIAENAASGRN